MQHQVYIRHLEVKKQLLQLRSRTLWTLLSING